MRPRRSVVERVVPSEPSPARTVVRLRVVGVLVIALFSLMFVRLWYLQVLDTKGFAQTVSANGLRNVEVPAARGLILDRTGGTMVGNQVSQQITLSRLTAQQDPQVVGQLADLLGITPQQIQGDLDNPQYSLYKPVPILQDAPMSDVLYIAEHQSQFPGVTAVPTTDRTYPLCPTNPPGACQTGVQMMGYVGGISANELAAHKSQGYQMGDRFGQTGLENQYETALRGSPGINHVEVDAKGQVVGSAGATQPTPGYDLATNIDAGLEQTLQQALDGQIATLHSSGGAAVAMDPRTGAVLAIASSPTYDPTWWGPSGISSANYQTLQSNGSLNNFAIDGLYTPGSTFKVATATAALETGLIDPSYTFNDPGSYQIPGCSGSGSGCGVFHDALGEHPGNINVSEAITVSSDDFFYNLGVMFWQDYKSTGRFGPTPIQNAANLLGYGDVTGIDLPGETPDGRVDSPQVVAKEHAQNPKAYPDTGWFSGNNLEMAFGQGGTVISPIEQAVTYSTFANGGTRYAPEVGAGLVDPITGKVVQQFAPKVMDHFSYSPANYQAMLSGFEGVVQSPSGTGTAAFGGFPMASFPLAGKTGTASVAGQQPDSWFVGFGPVPNSQYVITAVISGGGYGEAAAAPVVRQGFDYLVTHPESPTKLVAPAPTGKSSSACSPTAPATPGATSTTTTTAPGASTTTTAPPCTPTVGSPAPTTNAAMPAPGRSGSGGHGIALRSDRPRTAMPRAP